MVKFMGKMKKLFGYIMIKWTFFDFFVLFSLNSFKVMESQDFVKVECVFWLSRKRFRFVCFLDSG